VQFSWQIAAFLFSVGMRMSCRACRWIGLNNSAWRKNSASIRQRKRPGGWIV
jgi:hypothetical protein